MKGCLLLQRSFFKVGHIMAIVFKEKYGVHDFCGYTSTRPSFLFLQNQKEIKYSALLFDEEIHAKFKKEKLDLEFLKQLEKEYGLPNLWPYLTVDRILLRGQFLRLYPYDQPQFNHVDLLKILQVTAKAVIGFLDKEKPDFIFFPAVADLASFLLYEISRKKGIKIFFGESSRFVGHYMVTDNYRGFNSIRERFLAIQSSNSILPPEKFKRAQKLLDDFSQKPKAYDHSQTPEEQPIQRKQQLKFLLPTFLYKSIYWFLESVWDYFHSATRYDYNTPKPWFYFWDRLEKKARVIRGYEDLYEPINKEDSFVYFPLSVEPEMSLLLYAQFANDQIQVVTQVAKSLPVGYKLYVKEHPVMVGNRTRQFYKSLKKMPNVKLINPRTPSFDLIRNSKMVTTITGTAGWEAVVLGKPAITFGETFYNCLSAVKYCKSYHELPHLVKDQLENFKYDSRELINFTAAMLEDTVPVNMNDMWERERDFQKVRQGIEPLVDFIAQKMDLKPIK